MGKLTTLIKGYHGTSLRVAEKLCDGSLSWRRSSNEGDWLGSGIYFFQDGPSRAMAWARAELEGTSEVPAVIESELDLSCCFDLLDLNDFYVLRERARVADELFDIPAQEELLVRGGRAKPPHLGTPLKMRNRWDRFIIDFCIESLALERSITCVRSAFLWGHAVGPVSFLFNWSRVEIAVREPERVIITSTLCSAEDHL